MLLVGCGASGAIAGIFKAPIAGVAFTLEVLMLDLTMASISPLIISAVSGAAISYFLTNDHRAIFYFETFEPFALDRIPFLVILGVACGLMSLYFVRGTNWAETVFKKINGFSVEDRWVYLFSFSPHCTVKVTTLSEHFWEAISKSYFRSLYS